MSHKRITQFRGQWFFLSNFYRQEFQWAGYTWPTAEHAFQAVKTTDRASAEWILEQPTPQLAKHWGRQVTLRPGWDNCKVLWMLDILRAKFLPTYYLAEALLGTGSAHLEESNTWGDTFWGTVNGNGQNKLGLCLMKVRSELQGLEIQDATLL